MALHLSQYQLQLLSKRVLTWWEVHVGGRATVCLGVDPLAGAEVVMKNVLLK